MSNSELTNAFYPSARLHQGDCYEFQLDLEIVLNFTNDHLQFLLPKTDISSFEGQSSRSDSQYLASFGRNSFN